MAAFLLVFTLFLGLAFISKFFGISIFGKKLAGLPDGSMLHWPLIGDTLSFLKPHKSNSLGIFLQQKCSRYGNVFRSHLYGTPTIVSCDQELNVFILQNEGKLFETNYPKQVHDILGKFSILLVSGEPHRKLRSIAVSFVNASKSNPDFHGYVDKLSSSFIHSWKSQSQLLFYKQAKELSFYIMLKNLLNIEREDPLSAELLEDFLSYMKAFVSVPINIPGNAYSKAVKARKRISSSLKEIIRKREEMGIAASVRGDFLGEVLEKELFSDEEKVNILLDLALASYETTSGLMAVCLYYLAHSPSSVQTLQEEHEAVRKRKKDGEPLNWEDYKKMEFTSHVINEALRCGNIVKFVHRKAVTDVKFKEYIIPAGWQVLPILSAVHLDPSVHERHLEFNPWRWVDAATSRKIMAFGGGLRICPGTELAKLETAYFLHHFVLNFRWKTTEEDYPISCPYLDFERGLLLDIEQI